MLCCTVVPMPNVIVATDVSIYTAMFSDRQAMQLDLDLDDSPNIGECRHVVHCKCCKRGLILTSNSSTLQECNSTCDCTTVLKFCIILSLSLSLCECKL